MNPSQLEKDEPAGTTSLESTKPNTSLENSAGSGAESPSGDSTIDTTSESSTPPAQTPAPQPSWIKRLWHKANVYLLLFILIMVIGIGFSVVTFVQNRRDTATKSTIAAQDLSEDALEQLSNSTVTVGTPKQVLNVASNAVFSGAVLARSNLEVAGVLKIGGDLELPSITVAGASRLGQAQAETLSVIGTSTFQGTLTVRRGLSVTGNSAFDGALTATQISTNSLQLNGNLVLTNHVTAGGPIPSLARGNALGTGGTASVNGSDTAGSVTINTGGSPAAGCFVTLTFTKAFASVPHIVVTPVGAGAAEINYYINRSTSTFSICTASSAGGNQTFGFDYIILE